MKNLSDIILHRFIILLSVIFLPIAVFGEELFTVSGKVKSRSNNKNIENVSLTVPGTNIATVTNSDGTFSLKIPENLIENGIKVEQFGFRSQNITENDIRQNIGNLIVYLEPVGKLLKEVVVLEGNPKEIVREALKKIPDNYSDKNNLFTGFYRETVRKGNRFTGISEATVDILKRPYKSRTTNGEKVQIDRGRKLLSQKASDTLAVKLVGGPNIAIFLDAVKNGEHLFSVDELNYFDFKMNSPTSIDDRIHFAIEFKPIVKQNYPLYKGILYIDSETFAISKIEFELDMSDKNKVTNFILRKKPSGLYFNPQEVSGVVTYKLVDGKSYLNYISSKIRFKCDWKKKLFSSGYTINSEMVMVDRDDNPSNSIKFTDSFGQRKVFSDIVDNYWEEDFWKDYNIIEPTESLEKAVDKLKKRNNR